MTEGKKDVAKAVGTTAVGAATGAATYASIGGLGLTAVGTGVGITLGPFIAIGAGVFALGYGIFWLGKQVKHSESSATK